MLFNVFIEKDYYCFFKKHIQIYDICKKYYNFDANFLNKLVYDIKTERQLSILKTY